MSLRDYDFYLVQKGEVKLLTLSQAIAWDEAGQECARHLFTGGVLCFCKSEQVAFELVKEYDENKLQFITVVVNDYSSYISALIQPMEE